MCSVFFGPRVFCKGFLSKVVFNTLHECELSFLLFIMNIGYHTYRFHFSMNSTANMILCPTELSDLLMSSLCKINALLERSRCGGGGVENLRGAREVEFKQGTL
jgi:hypothetical protein